MKFSKLGFMIATAMFAVGAFADAANVLISFSTEGDTYIDGSPVLPGEWYALCWSPDGKFGGLKYDGTPVRDGDKVVCVGNFAKVLSEDPYTVGCPFSVFQVDSAVAAGLDENGVFCVYLLDTRDAEKTSVAKAKTESGVIVPESLNAATPSTTGFAAKVGGAFNMTSAETVKVETPAWSESSVDGVPQPVITKFNVVGDKVCFVVDNLYPGIKYNIKAGSSPTSFTEWALKTPKTVSQVGAATFSFDKSAASFFRVERAPLD